MNILAIDTSSKSASCAYLKDGYLMGELFINIGHTHSETILPMIKDLFRNIGDDISNTDLFAVTAGPGSFTGLRIGLATVKGLAFKDNTPVVSVSTLEALAINIAHYNGLIVPAMDARRSQVYTGIYKAVDGEITCLLEPDLLDISILLEKLVKYGESLPPILVGNGAYLVQNMATSGLATVVAPENLLHPRASSVAILASKKLNLQISHDELVPIYLGLAQAERELKERQNS